MLLVRALVDELAKNICCDFCEQKITSLAMVSQLYHISWTKFFSAKSESENPWNHDWWHSLGQWRKASVVTDRQTHRHTYRERHTHTHTHTHTHKPSTATLELAKVNVCTYAIQKVQNIFGHMQLYNLSQRCHARDWYHNMCTQGHRTCPLEIVSPCTDRLH